MKFENNLEKYVIRGEMPGDTLVVGARIHGDEAPGEVAARKIYNEFRTGKLPITKGTLIIYPRLNPFAALHNRRGHFPDPSSNVNRGLCYPVDGQTVEDDLRRAILAEFAAINCEAEKRKWWRPFDEKRKWRFLDFHGVPEPGKPHIFLSGGKNDLKFAQAIGPELICVDWEKAFVNVEAADLVALGCSREERLRQATTAMHAARNAGAYQSITVEAGCNTDPAAVHVAYQSFRNALHYCGMTNEENSPFPLPEEYTLNIFLQSYIRRDAREDIVGLTEDGQQVLPDQIVIAGGDRTVVVPRSLIYGNETLHWHHFRNRKPEDREIGQPLGFLTRYTTLPAPAMAHG